MNRTTELFMEHARMMADPTISYACFDEFGNLEYGKTVSYTAHDEDSYYRTEFGTDRYDDINDVWLDENGRLLFAEEQLWYDPATNTWHDRERDLWCENLTDYGMYLTVEETLNWFYRERA